MAKLAQFRKVTRSLSSGRFVVSEGIAPSEYLLPHDGLPTLYVDDEDDRFEIVIPKGTLLSVVTDANGDSRVVPANGSAAAVAYNSDGPAGGSAVTTGDDVEVPAGSTIIGAAQYDLYRPFDKGTSQGAGFITHGYVEWPVTDINTTLVPGDLVVADANGRPVKGDADANFGVIAGKVIAKETFADNFDDGLLSYMQLPSDPGAVKEVYSLTKDGGSKGKLGIRANLDVENVLGAVRVNLTI